MDSSELYLNGGLGTLPCYYEILYQAKLTVFVSYHVSEGYYILPFKGFPD